MHRTFRAGILVIAVGCLASSSTQRVLWRQTNGDAMATVVAEQAGSGDLAVIDPWYYALTFNRYYHGSAKWLTVPPIADLRYHRFDLFKEEMQTTNAIAPVLEQIEQTLRSGHRVFLLGRMPAWAPLAQMPPPPPVAPSKQFGWQSVPYQIVWENELVYFLSAHATSTENFVESATNNLPVNPFEDMRLIALSGWGTNSP